MAVVVGWSSIYLQLSSLSFFCTGLFSDILVLRLFLCCAYFWLFVNAATGFPNYDELWKNPATEAFLLHYDALVWSMVNFYVHFSKLVGLISNEKKVCLPEEYQPLWRILYRNGGLSELLFRQYIMPKFAVLKFKKGSQIPLDNRLCVILDGVADATITLQRSGDDSESSRREIRLFSGDILNVKYLNLFRSGSESEAFANQTVQAIAATDVTLYGIKDTDVASLAKTGQTKNAYQGFLIFALTSVAQREIIDRHFPTTTTNASSDGCVRSCSNLGSDGRNAMFAPLEEWEKPNPLLSGSGHVWDAPLSHLRASLQNSYIPPPPFLEWIPGLRHSMLPAPHLCPPEPPIDNLQTSSGGSSSSSSSKRDNATISTNSTTAQQQEEPTEKTSLV